MPLKTIFAVTSIAIGIIVYLPYYIGIWKGETKPHLFSWLNWSILTGLGFALSYSSGGGAGAYTFAVSSILNFTVAAYALVKREIIITRSDWLAFFAATLVTFFYAFTKQVLLSVVLAVTIDCLGYVPTFRKSYSAPHQEPTLPYLLWALSWVFAIMALQTYSFVTLFYPLTLIVIDCALVIFLLIRRLALATNS